MHSWINNFVNSIFMKKNYIFLVLLYFIFTSHLALSQTTETENFDSAVNGTEYDLSSESTPGGFWNGSNDDTSYAGWEIQQGTTPSSSTGPSGANSGQQYAYAETTYHSGTGTYILESDTFSSTSTTMSFYYHMYGNTIGTLTVE